MTDAELPNDMRAIVVRSYGRWQDASLERAPVPSPRPGEVLIRAQAAALNFPDLLMMEGGYQIKPELPYVAGRDVAGTIVALGEGVERLAVGQRVCAQPYYGSFADYALAPAYTTFAIPDAVSWRDAAACATVIATVVCAVQLRGEVKPGDTVMITGAAGGVGSMALQFVRLLGARGIAVVSTNEKAQAAIRLGADRAVVVGGMDDLRSQLREGLKEQGITAVDTVIDMVGGDVAQGALRCVRPGGRFVVVGFASGEIPSFAAGYVLVKNLTIIGSTIDRLLSSSDPRLIEALAQAFEALGEGRLQAEIDCVLPLERFAQGAERIAYRKAIGKVVFDIAPEPAD